MKKLIASALLMAMSAGCAFIKPTTEVRFSPATGAVHLVNTKDVNVTVKGLAVSKTADGAFTAGLDEVTLSDLSSPVITANVQQMLAFTEQQRAANEGIKIAFDGLTGIAQVISNTAWLGGLFNRATSSGVNIDTPWGGGGYTNSSTPVLVPDTKALAQAIEEIARRQAVMEDRLATMQPATQPEP